MKYVRRTGYALLLGAAVNCVPLFTLLRGLWGVPFTLILLPLLAVFLYINIRPVPRTAPTKRIQQ